MASGQIAIDRFDQRRRLHCCDRVIEETLLGAFEGRAGSGFGLGIQRAGIAGDVGRFQRRVEIVVNDAESSGVGIVNTDLLIGELVLHQIILDGLIAERACRIEAERAQIARQHLHGRDAAGLDRLDKLGAGGEREVLATPKAKPLRIGEIVNRSGAGRRNVHDARVRQRVLQAQTGAPLLRGGLIAAFAFIASGVLHGMALVEDDDAVEIGAQPIDDLPHARNLRTTSIGAQSGVGRK